MTRELFKMEIPKPGLPVLVLLFVVLFALGTGCTTDTALEEGPTTETNPEEDPVVETEPEEDPVPEPEPEEGPVPFEVLREVFSMSQNIVGCEFNYESIVPDSTDMQRLSGLELVLTSQSEFETYVSCDDTVKIDFEKEYVLAGKAAFQPNQVRIKEQVVEFKNDSVYYRVELINSYLTTPGGAEYIIKVLSRDYLEYTVFFDIYWEEE